TKNALVLLLSLMISANAFTSKFQGKLVGVWSMVDTPDLMPGADSICWVKVKKVNVQNIPSCMPQTSPADMYFYAWDCADPKRKEFMSLALAAHLAQAEVTIWASGTCPEDSQELVDTLMVN